MQAKTYVADRILTSRSIVEYLEERGLVGEHGIKGRRLFCCPLHNEDTPSFIVYPPEQERDPYDHFYCYGCKKGGNLITLKMALEGVSAKQAVADMADGLGIKVNDQLDYVIDQITKSMAAGSKAADEIEDCLLLASRAMYHHCVLCDWDDTEYLGCEAVMKLMDEAAERRHRERVVDLAETVPELLGKRARAYLEARERRNEEAAKHYAKI